MFFFFFIISVEETTIWTLTRVNQTLFFVCNVWFFSVLRYRVAQTEHDLGLDDSFKVYFSD